MKGIEKGWSVGKIDVKTAFLKTKLKEEIYIELPNGSKNKDSKVGKLNAALYGLKQASKQFYHDLCDVLMNKLKFKRSIADCCILKRDEFWIGVYVDDILMAGTEKNMKIFAEELGKFFEIRFELDLTDFLGIDIEYNKTGKYMKLSQIKLIDKVSEVFEQEIKKLQVYQTPAPQGLIVRQPMEGDLILDDDSQVKYRSGVGSLLYLCKYTRPDLSNISRELSKVIKKATVGDYKVLLRAIKYLNDTKMKNMWKTLIINRTISDRISICHKQ